MRRPPLEQQQRQHLLPMALVEMAPGEEQEAGAAEVVATAEGGGADRAARRAEEDVAVGGVGGS